MLVGRAYIDQKCCKMEEKARVVEEEVWRCQASKVSLNITCAQSNNPDGSVSTGEQAQEGGGIKNRQAKVVQSIQVKEFEMEKLAEALARSKKMVSELRTCHVSSVTHQQEIELKTELKEMEELWMREKAELEGGLVAERERVTQLAKELDEY